MKKLITLSFLFCFGMLSGFSATAFDHSIWDRYLGRYVSNEGIVNYRSMKLEMDTLDAYLLHLREHSLPTDASKEEKMAYYINAYNAYNIKFILSKYPVELVTDISYSGKDIWSFRMANLAGTNYTLNQLRDDYLRKFAEPRIHFAINNGAKSNPKLLNKAYTGDKLNTQLSDAAKAFITDPKHNVLSEKKLQLSELFSWFGTDFNVSGKTLIEFLNQYSPVTILPSAKIEYLPYSWNLND